MTLLDINLDLVNVDIDLDHLGIDHPAMTASFSDDMPLDPLRRLGLTRRWMQELGATPQEINDAFDYWAAGV